MLSQSEADLLERVAPFAFDGGDIIDENDLFFRTSGMTYENILRLEECGLVQRNMSWFVTSGAPNHFHARFGFLDRWVCISHPSAGQKWTLKSFRLTSAGRELLSLRVHRASVAFFEGLRLEAERSGFTLTLKDK